MNKKKLLNILLKKNQILLRLYQKHCFSLSEKKKKKFTFRFCNPTRLL
jgi:hypothetical protein